MHRGLASLGTLAFIGLLPWAFAAPSPRGTKLVQKLYERLTGVPLLHTDPRLVKLMKLESEGNLEELTSLITSDSAFYNVTLRDWAAEMSNREETPFVELDDFQTMIIGVARDDMDARLLLTGNFRYEGDPALALPVATHLNNTHYQQLEARRADLQRMLTRREPQWDDVQEAAGLLTTRAWARAHLIAGTNRRAVEFAFREFMCSPISQWKDEGLPDFRVRRDVDRAPSGEPQTYQKECRSCHAAMDGMAGAFANFDFVGERIVYYGPLRVAPKMNQNATVYPQGYNTTDTFFVNLATQHHNTSFGWRGSLDGIGVNEFGAMLANSRGFSRCLAQRAYKKICRHPSTSEASQKTIEAVTDRFEAGGYRLRAMFGDVAIQPDCLELN